MRHVLCAFVLVATAACGPEVKPVHDPLRAAAYESAFLATGELTLTAEAQQNGYIMVTLQNGLPAAAEYNLSCSIYEQFDGEDWAPIDRDTVCLLYAQVLPALTQQAFIFDPRLGAGTFRMKTGISVPDRGWETFVSDPFVLP